MKNKILLASLFVLNIGLIQSQSVYIYNQYGQKLYFTKTEDVKFITLNSSVNVEKRESIKPVMFSEHLCTS